MFQHQLTQPSDCYSRLSFCTLGFICFTLHPVLSKAVHFLHREDDNFHYLRLNRTEYILIRKQYTFMLAPWLVACFARPQRFAVRFSCLHDSTRTIWNGNLIFFGIIWHQDSHHVNIYMINIFSHISIFVCVRDYYEGLLLNIHLTESWGKLAACGGCSLHFPVTQISLERK